MTTVLNNHLLGKASLLGANTIVCNENKSSDSHVGIEITISEKYRIAGTWETYRYNRNIIDKLYQRYRTKFRINKIDIYKAIPKLIYWTNYKIGYLNACIQNEYKNDEILYMPDYLSKNKLKETIKYLRHFLQNNLKWLVSQSKIKKIEKLNGKIGLWVNDEFEVSIFEYLIKTIPEHELVLFHFGNIDFEKYTFITSKIIKINIGEIEKLSPQAFINPLFVSSEELAVLNIISKDWHAISSEIEQYKFIKMTEIKAIVINVGENLAVKNLMLDVFGDSIKVINTMNGNKAGEAHDADINFTTWCMWDDEMKKLMIEKCCIPEKKLYITGHLMEDHVREYMDMNTLSIDKEILKDKKVISVFSVRGNREEKKEALRYLYELIEKDQSYFILLRPHPSEKRDDYILPGFKTENFQIVDYNWGNSKQTLYDQINLSDIGIVFGSTVALECKWMGVPSITFEKKDTSDIYCVDGTYIKHIKTLVALKEELKAVQKKKVRNKKESDYSVASKIVDLINQD